MRKFTWLGVISVAMIGASAHPISAQQCACAEKKPPLNVRFHAAMAKVPARLDFALAYDYEWTKTSAIQNQTISLQGGLADVAYNVGKQPGHFAVVARVNGETAMNTQSGIGLSEIRVLGGPRFMYGLPSVKHVLPRLQIYGHALFGYTHGFDGMFPQAPQSPTLTAPSASSFALEVGGGLNLPLRGRLGIRLVEVDYVQTDLPNNANNHQDDIQASAGITFHLNRK